MRVHVHAHDDPGSLAGPGGPAGVETGSQEETDE